MNSSKLVFENKINIYYENFQWQDHWLAREKLLALVLKFINISNKIMVVEFAFC